MHIMRPILWGLHHVQGLSLHKLCQPDHHILLQGLKWCTWFHPSFLLATIVVILPTKLMSAPFLPKISFVIIMGKKDIKKLFVWQVPGMETTPITIAKSTSIFRCPSTKTQGLPLKLSPPKVIPIRMLRRKNTMLTKGRCFKPMLLKFKFCKMNSNHWGPNLLI